jgi:uncharacterized membrane protein YdcZ (DUF606 family)
LANTQDITHHLPITSRTQLQLVLALRLREREAKALQSEMSWLCWPAATAIGAGNVFKTGANSALAIQTSSVFAGTLSSFFGAWIVIGALDAAGTGRTETTPPWRNSLRKLQWWELSGGGSIGVISLGCSTAAAAPLGAVLGNCVEVTVEIGTSAIFDHMGFLGIEKKPMTQRKAVGMLLALCGAILCGCAADQKQDAGVGVGGPALIGYLVLGVIAGVTRPLQTCINGSATKELGSKVRSTFLSMSVGSAWLVFILGVMLLQTEYRHGFIQGLSKAKPWMFIGGPFSAATVFGAVAISQVISVSGFFLCTMLGQLVSPALAVFLV